MYYPIIHWHKDRLKGMTEQTDFFKNYANQMNKLQKKIRSAKLTNLFKSKVRQIYGIGIKGAEKILRAADLFMGDKNFAQYFENQFSQLITMKPFSQYGLKAKDFTDPNKSRKTIDNIAKYLENIEQGYNSIAKFLQAKDVDAFFRICASQTTTADVRETLQKLSQQKNSSISTITYNRFMDLDAAAQGILRAISYSFETIKDVNRGKVSLDKALSQIHGGKTFAERIVNNINSGMRQVLGFGLEMMVSELSPAEIVKILGPNARIEHSGDQTSKKEFEYSRSTVDVKFHGKLGRITLKAPLGATVKLTRKNDSRYYLKIKEGTSLGKLLDILEHNYGIIDEKDYDAFANIASNFRRNMDPEQAYEYADMHNLLLALNKVLFITGLAGSMTPNDFATILILNDKFYSIYDIIKAMNSSDWYMKMGMTGVSFSTIESISSEHGYFEPIEYYNRTSQWERSKHINDVLRAQKLDLKMSLDQNFLASLLKR